MDKNEKKRFIYVIEVRHKRWEKNEHKVGSNHTIIIWIRGKNDLNQGDKI